MPSLLIITDLFPPQFAPRIAYIVRFLVLEGWKIEVVTELIADRDESFSHGKVFADETFGCPVHRLRLRSRYNRLSSLRQTLLGEKERQMQRWIEENLDVASFDGIMGFSYRTFPLQVVARLGKRYHKPTWCDCRDLVEEYSRYDFLPQPLFGGQRWTHPMLSLLKRWFICQRTHALRHVKVISTVSSWHVDVLQKIHPKTSVLCIPNGYDEALFTPRCEPLHQEKLTIVFTGRILSLAMRDPSLLFDALQGKRLRSWVQTDKIRVVWYTDPLSRRMLQQRLASYPEEVGKAQEFREMVPFSQVPQILRDASIILLLGNKETPHGPHGMVTTKLFEAMATLQPILMVRSDEAVVAEALANYQDAVAAQNVDEVEEFIIQIASRQSSEAGLQGRGSSRFAQRFTRRRMAETFAHEWQEILANDSHPLASS